MSHSLERLILFSLIFLLPSQLALHLWPSWSLIHGIRVDYLSPTLYLTDLLIILLLIINKLGFPPPKVGGGTKGGGIGLLVICSFITLNLFFSVNPLISLYKYARLFEYFLLFKYLLKIENLKLKIAAPLAIATIWTSILTWLQLLYQRSLGNLWYWFGERTFNIMTPGIAKISVFGHLLLRPYATLPHPNALAGFSLVSGLIIYSFYTSPYPSPKLGEGTKGRGIFLFAITLAALTVPITFSRTAIILEIVLLIFFLLKSKLQNLSKFLFLILLLSIVYFLLSNLSGSSDSLPHRFFLNTLAVSTIRQSPIFGIGLGNFIPATANYLRQPVHNIYLLLASELGLPTLIFLSFIVIKSLCHLLKIKNWSLIIPVLVVLTTGLVDHYWLTLHQNSLLLVILMVLAYESISPHRQKYLL